MVKTNPKFKMAARDRNKKFTDYTVVIVMKITVK
jgi:hypothetical protein